MGKIVCFLAFFVACCVVFADEPEKEPGAPKPPVEKPQNPKDKPAQQPQPEKPKVPEGCIAVADAGYFKLVSADVQKLKWGKRGSDEKLEFPEDLFVVKFALTNSGKGTLTYVPAHSRIEETHRGRDDKNNVYKQAGTGEIARFAGYFPEGACTETVVRIEPGKSVEDIIVFEKPKPEAEKIVLTIETEPLLLTDYGCIEIEIPLLLGRPDPAKQPSAKFTEKAREKIELKVKGDAKIGNTVIARLLSAQLKRVSAVSKEFDVVVTAEKTSLIVKFTFENKTSKNIPYTAFLGPEFGMHVVARDDSGHRYGMFSLSGFDLCDAKSGLPSAIKAKETITDLLIIEPPQASAKFITIIVITDFLFPNADKLAGLLLAKIPLNNGKIDTEKNSYIKFVHQELALEQKTVIDIVDEWSTLDKTKWEDKYSGIRVSGKAKVATSRYIDEIGCTEVTLEIAENVIKQTTYVIEIIVPGSLPISPDDNVQYKGVIWGAKSEKDRSLTVLTLQVFGITVRK